MLYIKFMRFREYKKLKIDNDLYENILLYRGGNKGLYNKIFMPELGIDGELKKHSEYQDFLRLFDGISKEGILILEDGVNVREGEDVYPATTMYPSILNGLLAIYANLNDCPFYHYGYLEDRLVEFMSKADRDYTIYLDIVDTPICHLHDILSNGRIPLEKVYIDGIGIIKNFEGSGLFGALMDNIPDCCEADIDIDHELREESKLILERQHDRKEKDILSKEDLADICNTGQYLDSVTFHNILSKFTNHFEGIYECECDYYDYTEKDKAVSNAIKRYRYSFMGSIARLSRNCHRRGDVYDLLDKYPVVSVYAEDEVSGSYIYVNQIQPVKNPNITDVIVEFFDNFIDSHEYSKYVVVLFWTNFRALMDSERQSNLFDNVDRYIFIDMKNETIDIANGKDIIAASKFINGIS